MDNREQIDAFQRDIMAVIARYRAEFELTAAAAVGTLEIIKLDLWEAERRAAEDQPGD